MFLDMYKMLDSERREKNISFETIYFFCVQPFK